MWCVEWDHHQCGDTHENVRGGGSKFFENRFQSRFGGNFEDRDGKKVDMVSRHEGYNR